MRHMIFEKYSGINKPWIISDSCINLFEAVDRKAAKEDAQKWWDNDGNYSPEKTGTAADNLDPVLYKSWMDYAVLEAGRAKAGI